MKHRLLVMNGQRLVQGEREGQWVTTKVEKALGVKPGIYDTYLACAVDKATICDGVILHADKDHVFQQCAKVIIRHDMEDFVGAPEVGCNLRVQYDNGKAIVIVSSNTFRRKRSR
jgi:hypothetical protein